MELLNCLRHAISINASDIFIIAGRPVTYTVNSKLLSDGEKLFPGDTESTIREIYTLAKRDVNILLDTFDDDFSFSVPSLGRFRVNTYKQRNSLAAVLRSVVFELPKPATLNIPPEIVDISKLAKGLILVTGPAGSGKSTTLSCIIDKINKEREAHIITLEDPLEYLHRHEKSIVSQREVGMDTESYSKGLRAALRESPNVILLGEMRDFDTISIALSAAETGQLVLSTLHTLGTANTVDRIIDVFPPNQQHQIRIQLSMVLKAVICQQIIPTIDGNMVPAFEIMFCNNAIRTLIREAKTHQIDTMIQSSSDQNMISMDNSILSLYKKKLITAENALFYSMNPEALKKKLV